MTFTDEEIKKLEAYLSVKFGNQFIVLRPREKAQDSVEMLVGGEFLAIIYKNEDEGEVSYDLNMAIIEEDLAG